MKKLYSFLLLLGCAAQAQIVNIPDPDFKNYLLSQEPAIDTNGDGEIQVAEAQAATALDIGPVQTLSGIEAFVNLISLKFGQTGDHTLDLSMISTLQHLESTDYNSLNTLNLSGLSQLTHVDLSHCLLEAIDLSASATAIEYLSIQENALHTGDDLFFDCTMFTNLKHFDGRYNAFPVVLTGLTHLEYVDIIGTSATALDVTASAGSLETLMCGNNSLASLDVSSLVHLKTLICNDNLLTSLAVDNLTALEELTCPFNNISSLNLTNLINLKKLHTTYNPLGTLDVSGAQNLEELICGINNLTSLNLTSLTQLKTLDYSQNQVSNIDLSNQTALIYLGCAENAISTIDLSACTSLKTLMCHNNQLASLDVSLMPDLETLLCDNNQLTSIDLSNSTKLYSFSGSQNLFTTLDFSAYNNYESLNSVWYSFNDNPFLEYVNMKNGANPHLPLFENGLGVPNLTYICVDEDTITDTLAALSFEGSTSITVNSYCSFTPGGTHNTIQGIVRFDANLNGCDESDLIIPGVKIRIDDESNVAGATFSDASGQFTFYTTNGVFDLTPEFENQYFTLTPASATITFNALDGSTQVQNFCIAPNGIHNDLEVTVAPTSQARPGFDAHYLITYKNKGNQTLSGGVNLAFDGSILDFVEATASPSGETANSLTWAFANLAPFETRSISLTMNVNSPLETPAVNIDDHLFYTASITPLQDDETPEDNQMTLDQTVVGSFDPNDKTCLEGNTITPEMVGDYLHYLIRFQNSGTFYAENVVVTDIIDTNKFDISSLQLTASSHPHVTRITGNKVEFIFEGINLPAEQDDEPGSHGFVAFKIKTLPNLVLNDVVENTADIFFDFNAPIVTNTTSTTVSNLGIGDVASIKVSMTPNPVRNSLAISAEDDIQSVQVFDLQGRLLQTRVENDTQATIDFSDKTTGVYFVKVTTEKGMKMQKIIKE